ncbi:phage integrase N-terminal SAM-like domain-containing protein [Bacteroidota bacterium]
MVPELKKYTLTESGVTCFSIIKPTKKLNEIHIKESLNHLTEKEKVSTSTRNQTLKKLIFLYKNALTIKNTLYFSHF